jgi:hypothetical protein
MFNFHRGGRQDAFRRRAFINYFTFRKIGYRRSHGTHERSPSARPQPTIPNLSPDREPTQKPLLQALWGQFAEKPMKYEAKEEHCRVCPEK